MRWGAFICFWRIHATSGRAKPAVVIAGAGRTALPDSHLGGRFRHVRAVPAKWGFQHAPARWWPFDTGWRAGFGTSAGWRADVADSEPAVRRCWCGRTAVDGSRLGGRSRRARSAPVRWRLPAREVVAVRYPVAGRFRYTHRIAAVVADPEPAVRRCWCGRTAVAGSHLGGRSRHDRSAPVRWRLPAREVVTVRYPVAGRFQYVQGRWWPFGTRWRAGSNTSKADGGRSIPGGEQIRYVRRIAAVVADPEPAVRRCWCRRTAVAESHLGDYFRYAARRPSNGGFQHARGRW